MLSDRELTDRIARGDIKIDPFLEPELQIQPASIDLRLGYEFLTFNYTQTALIDPLDPHTFEGLTTLVRLNEEQRFIVHPGEFVLGTTLERLEVPNDLVGQLDGRSSLGRLGIIIHSTAGFIDPGFVGNVTLEISNLGNIAVALYPAMRICQLSFEEMGGASTNPYARRRASKYQGQQLPTISRIYDDPEFVARRQRLAQAATNSDNHIESAPKPASRRKESLP
jgi:dCTP deaminase